MSVFLSIDSPLIFCYLSSSERKWKREFHQLFIHFESFSTSLQTNFEWPTSCLYTSPPPSRLCLHAILFAQKTTTYFLAESISLLILPLDYFPPSWLTTQKLDRGPVSFNNCVLLSREGSSPIVTSSKALLFAVEHVWESTCISSLKTHNGKASFIYNGFYCLRSPFL